MIARFGHVSVCVESIERCLTFYRDILGLQVVMERDSEKVEPEHRELYRKIHAMADLRFKRVALQVPGQPNFSLELAQWFSPTPRPVPAGQRLNDTGFHVVGLRTDNIQEVYDRVARAGVKTVSDIAESRYLKCFKCYDPEGNVVEFIEMKVS
ncbi:MAG: VOC family protein [Chloroflexi bacterium]|nr:VOC family protein [Chloroflexota bacterium]